MVAKCFHVVAFAYKGYRLVFEGGTRSPGLGRVINSVAGFCGGSEGGVYRKVVAGRVAGIGSNPRNSVRL